MIVNNTEIEKTESCYHIDSQFESVDSNTWLTNYTELFYNDGEDYWEPPVSFEGLAQLAHANAYHGSILVARANAVVGRLVSSGKLRKHLFQRFVRDYFQFGQAAFIKLRNSIGQVTGLHPLPAMFLRKKANGDFFLLERDFKKRLISADDVIFLTQYDPSQQIYGLPDYLGGLQSNLLNKDSTLFRRRYYKNGAHMGFIFYSTDPRLKKEDEDMLKEKIASSKGVGNFKSMFINIPNGHEKGVQLIPVGNLSTKDEFEAIKSITAQDILVSHRFPSGKAGIVPTNTGGFGDPIKVGEQYLIDEVLPICEIIQDEINNDTDILKRKDLQLTFNLNSDIGSKA